MPPTISVRASRLGSRARGEEERRGEEPLACSKLHLTDERVRAKRRNSFASRARLSRLFCRRCSSVCPAQLLRSFGRRAQNKARALAPKRPNLSPLRRPNERLLSLDLGL